jgi:1,4-alpha-glucan branching enzyme
VAWAGFRHFFVDSHMARAGGPLGVYGELFGGEPERVVAAEQDRPVQHSPYAAYRVTDAGAARSVAALVRDPRSSMQVWSRQDGYPGAPAYLEFHKIRWPGGLKLWRVSAPGTDLGDKEPYDAEAARGQATAHAGHFAHLLDRLAKEQLDQDGSVIVAPFDTELFGHWWFEGPDFLGDLYAQLPDFGRLRATTAGSHLDAHGAPTGLRLAAGSWGRNGDYSMWQSPHVDWTWPVIWAVEDRFWSLAPRALANEGTHEVLAQAARAMLLLQSSDWQFIISTGEVEDYAIRRFNGHAADCTSLLDALAAALDGQGTDAGVRLARDQQRRDDVFRDMVPSIAMVLGQSTVHSPRSTGHPSLAAGRRPQG